MYVYMYIALYKEYIAIHINIYIYIYIFICIYIYIYIYIYILYIILRSLLSGREGRSHLKSEHVKSVINSTSIWHRSCSVSRYWSRASVHIGLKVLWLTREHL